MWISDNWKDYELIDCGDGNRLERWKDYTLVRPDPAAIWPVFDKRAWANPNATYLRSNTGGGNWKIKNLPSEWSISYDTYGGRLNFNVRAMGFKHTGIFPEQAVNWDFISKTVKESGRKVNVLNLFAYTGAAGLAAAVSGANVCHVDAAKGMVAYAKENTELSNLTGIRFIVDDCFKFVNREIKRGKRYDAVILDPPSYGRGPAGEVWKLEEGLFDLMSLITNVLTDNPLFVLLNSYTTGVSPKACGYITELVLKKRFGGNVFSEELGLKATKSGIALPCGNSTRWINDIK